MIFMGVRSRKTRPAFEHEFGVLNFAGRLETTPCHPICSAIGGHWSSFVTKESAMLYRTHFLRPRLHEAVQLQRALQAFVAPSLSSGAIVEPELPTVQVRSHNDHLEVALLAAGLAPASIEVTVEQGILNIAGLRPDDTPEDDAGTTVHTQERFFGRINRRLRLPDDIDPQGITARYADGALLIRIQRRAPEAARHIAVQ
jgi:HSP20 family protein